MGKIVLRRFVKPKPKESKVIRVDSDVYEKLEHISDQTSISIQRLTSLLLNAAIEDVVIIDNEMEVERDED